jgi:hypothetical protein
MDRLLALIRAALRSGDVLLAADLTRILRADPELRERVDLELQELPRLPPRRSPAGERLLLSVWCGLRPYLR